METEEKEKTCPVEDVKNYTEKDYGLQIETEEAETSNLEVKPVTPCKVMTNADKDVQETPHETISTPEVSTAVEETSSSVASLTQEEQSNKSPPAKKTRRGAPVRMAEKSGKSWEHQVDLDSLSATVAETEKKPSADSVKSVPSLRGRRGKSAIEQLESVLVQSPAKKSTRGRIAKEQVEASNSSSSTENEQVAPKPRRGRKQQDAEVLQVCPVIDLKASAKVEDSMKSPASARARRGRKGKHESENPPEPEALPEASVEEVGVASESAELQPSAKTEASNTRAKRGRTTRKEPTSAEVKKTSDVRSPDAVKVVESAAESEGSLKSTRRGRLTRKDVVKTSKVAESPEPMPIVMESVVESKLPENTDVQTVAVTPVKATPKPRRGRAANKAQGTITAQVEETSKPASDTEVLPVESTEMPLKSRRGRRGNPVALNNKAVVTVEPEPEAPAVRSGRGARNKTKPEDPTKTVPTPALTEEQAEEPVVKNIRGGRRAKPPEAQVLDETQEEAQDKPTSIDLETSQQLEAPAARSTRGKRTAAVKEKPEVPVKRGRGAATVEVSSPVVRSSRARRAAAKSEPEEVTEDSTVVMKPVKETSTEANVTPLVQADSEVVARRGRGKTSKTSKILTEDQVNKAEEVAAAPTEPHFTSEEEPAAEDHPSIAETKQSVPPPVKGRKGRGAKKQEEPETEKPAAEETVQPLRRGRAAARQEVVVSPKRGQKRKEAEVAAEETPDTEALPKRRRGKVVGAEAQADTAAPGKGRKGAKEAENAPEGEAEEPPKKEEKPARGRRKAAQDEVLPQPEDPVPGEFFTFINTLSLFET